MASKKQKIAGAAAGVTVIAGGLGAAGASGAFASDEPTPPKGARAVVKVTPNPTTERGQEVTITGNCGGGEKLRAVHSGFNGKPVLEHIRILSEDPNGFEAKATVSQTVGNGVGPVFVDCGGEAGVTLLVTHV
ncbi:hypothetical protein ACPZ19_08435 [Amycolatopsis lurida]